MSADEIYREDHEWIVAVNIALGGDRNRAAFVDDAVKMVVDERDALKLEVVRLRRQLSEMQSDVRAYARALGTQAMDLERSMNRCD